MSFKNAIKLVFSKFNMVWARLAGIFATMLIIIALCVDPILTLYDWLKDVGFTSRFVAVWSEFVTNGNFAKFINGALKLIEQFFGYYVTNPEILWNFTLKFGFLILILYKFLRTTFDLGFSKQIYGIMSDNSKPGFWVSYISQFAKSLSYSAVKTVIFALYDITMLTILYFSIKAVFAIPLLIPFVAMFIIFICLTIRSSLFFAWLPYITVEKRNMFIALNKSVTLFFKNFGRVFSAFLIAWICIISLCVFLAVFTFGVALIIAVPVCSVFLSFLNMTLFYSSNEMRYYLVDKIFDINYV